MTLFRKLFVTYLLVSVLAIVISGGFAGYLVWESAGKAQIQQMQAYGHELAALLENEAWTDDRLRQLQTTADVLDRTQPVSIWLVDRTGLIRLASSSAASSVGSRMEDSVLGDVLASGRAEFRWWSRSEHSGPRVAVPVYQASQVQGAILLSPALQGLRQARMDILRFILYGSAISAVVLAVISFYMSQRISLPVTAVSVAARKVAKGDFGSRVHWPSTDEVGRLALSFNEMASELERLERARRELMANVSHELKGPLARMAGYLEAIHDGIGGPEARQKHFEIVRRESARLSRLVNDLLDFSRMEAGRLKLHLFPCDLSPHLARATEVFGASAQTAGVTLATDIPDVLPIVSCDPERVEQALANLLENALAHTPSGGSVTVSAGERAGSLCVTVEDTGSGLPPEEWDRVWERFYKVDRARPINQGHSGLGLAIVKQLIELQGGEVFVTSEVGVGSRFGFLLPLAPPE